MGSRQLERGLIMAILRAKMRLYSIAAPGSGSVEVRMQAQYDTTQAEDQAIAAIFPSGDLRLIVQDADTLAGLTAGAVYYVDLTLAAMQPANILRAVPAALVVVQTP